MKTIKELYDEKVWKIDFSPEPSLAFAEGFEIGARAMFEELTKHAVQGSVYQGYAAITDKVAWLHGIKNGDKFKLIIVKEEDV